MTPRIWAATATILLTTACSERQGPQAAPADPPKTLAPATHEAKTMSFHSFSAAPLGLNEPVSLSKYQGKVLLVANTASHCGYTPQYTPLGDVERKYKDRGLVVLGFLSDDFGHQAGTVDEVKACSLEHRATFDQFAELHAKKGPDQAPIFAWLTSQPGFEGDVKWNFHKWLIGKHGELLGRWPSATPPDGPEITAAIEKALAS